MPENSHGIVQNYSTTHPQPRREGIYWVNNGVGYYRDASYLKVQNITLGYNIPKNILERANIKQLRLYVNILNPFVFTKYDGLDPEWAESNVYSGRVASVTTQFGLNLKF
jgi:hypothetical protein